MFVSRQTTPVGDTTLCPLIPTFEKARKNGLSPKGEKKTSEQHEKVPAFAGMRGGSSRMSYLC